MDDSGIMVGTLFQLGPLQLTNTVVTTWVIMAVTGLFGWLVTRRLHMEPGPIQTVAEGIVSAIEGAIRSVAPDHVSHLLPFIGSLWIFLVVANLSGLLPGVHAPTRDLSATAALAMLVFLSTHWFGIRSQGLSSYLPHYLKPSPILLPFHVIGEITRIVALAVRLFGNMMGHEIVLAILFGLAGAFFAPLPIMALGLFVALLQAFVFFLLSIIYFSGAMEEAH